MTTRFAERTDRLLKAIEDASRKWPTVAEEIESLTWYERFDRLQTSGKLLSESEVKRATLEEIVGPRDIVVESERREQRRRDQEQQFRLAAVEQARDDLLRYVGEGVPGFVSRFAGEWIGAVVGWVVAKAISAVAFSAASQVLKAK